MNETLMILCWNWGIFTFGVIIFFLGFLFGVFWYKDRCEKRIKAEAFRLAITNTIKEPEYLEDAWEES